MKSNIIINYKKSFLISSFLVATVVLFGITTHVSAATTATNNRGLEGVTYTSRSDRGADETWRLTARTEYQEILAAQARFSGTEEDGPTEAEKKQHTATEYILGLFAGDFKIDRIVKGIGKNQLRWPNQYKTQKTKILVHHTADNNDSLPQTVAEEKEYMKTLYRFHAFSRGRGDIGYNFIVMPSGRIYEGKAGGSGVVGAHATWNNTPSVGISLVGNFEEKSPTQEQVNALTTLATSISKKYKIDPLDEKYYFKTISTFPYIKAEKHNAIAGHRDAGTTKCPGQYLYDLLPTIRQAVSDRLRGLSGGIATIPVTAPTNTTGLQQIRSAYINQYGFTPSRSSIQKLEGAPAVDQLATIIQKPIPVLLYDASTSLEERSLSCSTTCVVRINGTVRTATTLKVKKSLHQFAVTLGTRTYKSSKFAVTVGTNGTIQITNYNRKSGTTALNTFRQSLLFSYGPMKKIDLPAADQHQVINIVSLDNYLKGMGEASDSQSQTKANVLAMVAKGYILYYAGGTLRHQSIPEGALYVITDDPRISQKYSGAGGEGISTKRLTALTQTKGQYVVYNSVLPILPYFHCSAGFTRSAQEKRGWTDTPYLQSVVDAGGKCDSGDFEGHGVGLSGNGSSKMADDGKTVKEILQYYYPGIDILSK